MTTGIAPKHSFTYDGAQIDVYHADKGQGLPSHTHSYSHATICNAGSCLISLEGRSHTVNKDSQPLNLPAAEWHEIEALEDGTVFVNVFAVELFKNEMAKASQAKGIE
jgi:quercetin dioxygenase-like cupin family protein